MVLTLHGTHLVSRLWYLDSSQELKNNNGYTVRLKYIGNSPTVELYGRLYANLFNFDKMLINVGNINIKLTRTQDFFIYWHLPIIKTYV